MLPQQRPEEFCVNMRHLQEEQQSIEDSDQDEIDDAVGESEPESEGDEDLPLEMDDGRNASKVSRTRPIRRSPNSRDPSIAERRNGGRAPCHFGAVAPEPATRLLEGKPPLE